MERRYVSHAIIFFPGPDDKLLRWKLIDDQGTTVAALEVPWGIETEPLVCLNGLLHRIVAILRERHIQQFGH